MTLDPLSGTNCPTLNVSEVLSGSEPTTAPENGRRDNVEDGSSEVVAAELARVGSLESAAEDRARMRSMSTKDADARRDTLERGVVPVDGELEALGLRRKCTRTLRGQSGHQDCFETWCMVDS